MGIWIRSQNGQNLINAETIRYYNCYHGSVNAIIADEFFMGDYLLNAKLNKKKNKENSQNKRKSLIKVNE